MKKKNQVVLNLQGLSVPDKIKKAKANIKAMTGNENFPDAKEQLSRTSTVADKL